MRSLISLSTGVSYSCMVLYPPSAYTEKYVHSHPRPQDRNAPTNYLCLVNYLSPFPSYQHQFVNCFPDQFQEWIPIRHNAHCVNITSIGGCITCSCSCAGPLDSSLLHVCTMHIPQAIDRDNMVIDPTTYMEYCTKLSSF